jgi:adenylosuccinate synthase
MAGPVYVEDALMPNIVIVGAQWGDEGKGKVVDLLTDKVQVVARYNGGHNAGHTILVGQERFVLHLIPSGILHPGILCVMGNGMVIDPWALEKEIAELRARGVTIEDNLVVSDRAHLILPHHRALEAMTEEMRGDKKIGTTLRGIGPAYEDKAGRRGVRASDLLRPADLPDKLAEARRHYELVCRGAGRSPDVDWDRLASDLAGFGERLRPRIADASLVLQREMAHGYSVLFEGAQATLLDLDHGTYPFVTSSNPIAGAACVGAGVGPTDIDEVWGVAKAYATRVGAGPFPTELDDAVGRHMLERGHEYGTTTGRERRCGWMDLVALRYAVRLNRMSALTITKLDVLSGIDPLRVAVRYRSREGAVLDSFPYHQSILHSAQPEYEELPGFEADLTGCRSEDDLPAAARAYLEFIAEFAGVPIRLVGVGPGRDQVVWIGGEEPRRALKS